MSAAASESRTPSGRSKIARTLWLILLAAGPLGASVGFGLQYELLTLFTRALGMPQEYSSLVWLCGPVTGMIVQPLVGRYSDHLKVRVPFILLGGFLLIVASLMVLGAVDLGALVGDIGDSHHNGLLAFIIGFWLLDASNNTLYVLFRALCADEGSSELVFSAQQSWASLGLILGYWIGEVDWANTSVGTSFDRWFGASSCPQDCAQGLGSCPENYVDGCFDLRMAFSLNIIANVLSVACCLLARWRLHRGQIAGTTRGMDYTVASVTSSEGSDVEARPATAEQEQVKDEPDSEPPPTAIGSSAGAAGGTVRRRSPTGNGEAQSSGVSASSERRCLACSSQGLSYRRIYWCTLLSWLGWFSIQIYQSQYVAVEVLGGPERIAKGKEYTDNLHWASRGFLASAILSWVAAVSLPFVLKVVSREVTWMISNFLLAGALAVSPLVRGKQGALLWQGSFGPMYSVTQSVPYAMLADIADPGSEGDGAGSMMGCLNIGVCIPQLVLALVGGPISKFFATDVSVFYMGGVGALMAGVLICLP